MLAATFTAHSDTTTNGAPNSPTAADLAQQAANDAESGKLDRAVVETTEALELDPKNTTALEVRGAIYVQEKLWDLAERDYTTLNQISPDPAYRYKLAQIKFLQKEYDEARPMFAALKDDARLGDLARYKVFICDLFGGHEAIAARDLALLDQTGDKPSYYFGRAVWCGTHDQPAAATRYISQATGRFSTTICDLYAAAYAHARLFNPALASFTTKDGREFKHARVALEQDGLRVSTNSGWVTIPLDQLPDDLSTFSDDLRDQIDLQRHSAVSTGAGTVPVSFTTRHGRTYDSAQAWLGDYGVDLMTATGPVSVPFADLPADLSPFPADWRTAIQAQRKSNASHTTPETTVSFTTKTGTVYNTVSATLGSDGVMILTPEGLTTVPFTDLPADLSAFPASWRPLIQDWLKSSLGDTSGVQVVSFTTRRGKHYDQVRAALDDKGLDVLGPDGWVEVSFDEVPADLSPFPAAWREAIATGQKAPANAPNN